MNKRLMLLPLLSIFLCFSCGGGDTPTPTLDQYKVEIISDSKELTPKTSSFTFEKDTFKPVTIEFTGSEMQTIKNAVTSVEGAADITEDYENKSITITPKRNCDFNVFVGVKEITYFVFFTGMGTLK